MIFYFSGILWLFHMLFYWTLGITFMIIDYSMPYESLLKYKTIHQAYIIEKRKNLQWDLVNRSIFNVIRNQLIALPSFLMLIYLHKNSGMDFSLEFKWNIIGEVLVYSFLIDFLFYLFHRLCHYNKWLYKNVHASHHDWIISMGISSLDTSILEFALTIIIPLFSSLLITSNFLSLLISVIGVTTVIVFAHCGYYIPILNTNKHDIHHIYYQYNYSAFCDYIFGTSKR